MTTILWLLTGAALLIAAAALVLWRRTSHRLDRLVEQYWDLRYDHTQLRARVARLDPEEAPPAAAEEKRTPGTTFIALSSLKK